jgi:arylsulfatase A-like enzyme/putative intracellular protease/amidase
VSPRPDIIVLLTDEERAPPPYEGEALQRWRREALHCRRWFAEHGVSFERHYAGSLACAPSRSTLFTGHYPDLHGVTQTDGLGKSAHDSRMRWLRKGEVPTLGHYLRLAGYDTHYDGKWHLSHADLPDPLGSDSLATNDERGRVIESAVNAYLQADPLDAYGFSGWVGPEPHGPRRSNTGLVRDPLLADRVVAWLRDRYARRRAGDERARRPFLLVASFVNPHDIVLFPAARSRLPLSPSPLDPPHVAAPPTRHEDLKDKPAAQIAYRSAYYSGYGPAALIAGRYRRGEQSYRDLYYRLHLEVDQPLERVRRAVVEDGSHDAFLVLSSDHGELLGAHGGLHQKWFNLYDEATRVPLTIARIGAQPTVARRLLRTPTSHVYLLPTLLAVAGVEPAAAAERLRAELSEVHPLPGRNLLPLLEGDEPLAQDRAVYLMTRDHVLEGDGGASAAARVLGVAQRPPLPLRIDATADVGASLEAIVVRVPAGEGGRDHLWKLVRTFDDPATWSEPFVRQLAASGPGGERFRSEPLVDQWELYDLDDDPIEARNRARDPECAQLFAALRARLSQERTRAVPARNRPWPYASAATPRGGAPRQRPKPPALLARKLLQRLGMHPSDPLAHAFSLPGRRALIVCTNHAVLDVGKPTGVFASEMTVPYYAFADAGMDVELASPRGGVIPIDPLSLRPVLRCDADDRMLADPVLRTKIAGSHALGALDIGDYDLVYLAGGWGAAFDFADSEPLARQLTLANARGAILGGVCHGPLGLRDAKGADGRPLVAGRRITAVTDKQVRELGIDATPYHPETELRRAGARFEASHRRRDPLANHWVVDGNLVTGQNQNAAPMVAREMMALLARKLA